MIDHRDPPEAFNPGVLEAATPGVRQLFDYWDACRAGRSMPSREDFDPIDLPRLMPGMILVDVEGERPDGSGIFRYRLVGSDEVEARRHNPTGKLIEDGYYASSLDSALGAYEFVRSRGIPLYDPLDFVDRRGRRVQESSILLPFSEDGVTVSQILVYSERLRSRC